VSLHNAVRVSLCAALCAAAYAAVETDEGVYVGTDDNFAEFLETNEYVLAEFYAPWCGHCKQLAPEYAQAAQDLAAASSPVKLMKLDATTQTKTAEQFEVQGYPTLKWFKNGQAAEFSGGRTAADIVSWVNKKSGPVPMPAGSVDEAKSIQESNPVSVFGFFESAETDEYKHFALTAEASELTYVVTFSAAVATEFGVTMPKIVVYTDFDDKVFEYDGDLLDQTAINNFAIGSSLPLIMEFTEEAAPKIFGGEVKSHFLFFQKFSDDSWNTNKAAFSEVAKDYRGKVLFITLDVDKADNGRIMEFFGLKAEETPTYRIINVTSDMEKFSPPTADLSAEAIGAFAKNYVSGTVEKHLMSEPESDDWDANPVKVLTGSNFERVALDPTKDVLVEFYAPWCGHCKQLVPIYDKLAEAYESNENVVIAKMDSTANEVSGITIESFPTLKLFPKGEGADVVDHDGERTLKGFVDWLAEKTGTAAPEVGDEPDAGDAEAGEDGAEGGGDGPPEDKDGSHDEL